ncbi:MAG: DEAD/DEAH box helicase [Gemmatimonadota bacterium]
MTKLHDDLRFLLDGCRGAVGEEIDAVRADLDRRGLAAPVAATAGVRVSGTGAAGLYDWTLPSGTYGIRVDDAVSIDTESGSGLGFVVHFDGNRNVLRIATDAPLGARPGSGQLTFDPTWLLEALNERLTQIGENPERYHVATALKLFGQAFPHVGQRSPQETDPAELNGSQTAALTRILGSEVQFVWGPPGTGKTRVLGYAGAALAGEGRVLIVAATNAAVDEAAARVAGYLGPDAIEANRLLRFGAGLLPGSDARLGIDAAITRSERLRPSGLSRAISELAERLGLKSGLRNDSLAVAASRVQAAARRTGDPADAALAMRVAAAYQAATRRVVESADVVLATLARLAVRDELAALRFDSLLIDEASAATLPYTLFAACLAGVRVAVFGDFQQLPAVVKSRGDLARDWMRKDIFRASGVLESADGLPSPRDRLCSMLDQQYRMRPAIRALIGDLFYGGRLRDGLPDIPSAGELVLIDTAGLDPRVTRIERSRRNDEHLEALLQVLELLGRRGLSDVAVVAPYRIQARELRRLVRSRLGRAAPAGLEIATIHRFQGREKRVVVFDTVDAPPTASWFLDERRNPDFPRMLNVALSRSRDLLIVLATVEGLRRTLPEEALLNRVVNMVLGTGVVVDGRRVADLHSALGQLPAAPLV